MDAVSTDPNENAYNRAAEARSWAPRANEEFAALKRLTRNDRTCRDCAQFVDDPAAIEAWIPNFTMLGSAYSSARGVAGICQVDARFMDPVPASGCSSFKIRGPERKAQAE